MPISPFRCAAHPTHIFLNSYRTNPSKKRRCHAVFPLVPRLPPSLCAGVYRPRRVPACLRACILSNEPYERPPCPDPPNLHPPPSPPPPITPTPCSPPAPPAPSSP